MIEQRRVAVLHVGDENVFDFFEGAGFVRQVNVLEHGLVITDRLIAVGVLRHELVIGLD